MAYPDALPRQGGGWFDTTGVRAVLATLKHDFARDFFQRVALQILAVMGLIEAIFLAERFTIVFDAALQKNANLFDISLVLACTSTEIFDLALALAVLTAVYWVCLQMREERELLVLSAAGIGIFQIIVLVMAVAMAAQFGSLAVSGFVDPASRYAERLILFDAEYRALRSGVTTGQFYYFPHHVAFAPPKKAGPDRRPSEPGEYYFSPNYVAPRKGPRTADDRLFVYESKGPGVARIITADHAYLDGPDSQGRIFLKVRDFGSHTLLEAQSVIDASGPQKVPCRFQGIRCPDKWSELPQLSMHVRNLSQEMSIEELIPFPPRGSDVVEQTLFDELFKDGAHPAARRTDEMSMLGQRFARGLLCLLAPLMALAGVSLTTRFTNNFALPLACMALMSLDLATERLIRAIAPDGPVSAVAIPLAVALGLAAALIWLIRRVQGAVVRPQLSRP
jgi:lipopolysaccharide export system permease protein